MHISTWWCCLCVFRGDYDKPSLWDVLWVRIVLLPYTLAVYTVWWVKWHWRYSMLKEEYRDVDRQYLTMKALGLTVVQWEVLDCLCICCVCYCCSVGGLLVFHSLPGGVYLQAFLCWNRGHLLSWGHTIQLHWALAKICLVAGAFAIQPLKFFVFWDRF